MALNTSKCNHLSPLAFKGLTCSMDLRGSLFLDHVISCSNQADYPSIFECTLLHSYFTPWPSVTLNAHWKSQTLYVNFSSVNDVSCTCWNFTNT